MVLTRADALIMQELDELLGKSTPYSLSTPQFGNPTLHDFVKGLILSTNIIEHIDKHIPNGFRADWGQVINVEDGNALSKECDIIIYEGKPYKTIENKSIKFVLVDRKQAKIVIQVRTGIQSVTKESKEYCKEVRKYVPELWFISECCWAKSENRAITIERELKNAGYKQFIYFYRMDENTLNKTINYKSFIKFTNMIKKLR
jgi:hypothetical protein